MKKVLVSLMLVIVMMVNILALAGCDWLIPSGNNGEITIKFSHTMGENLRTVLDEYIVEFNKLYPNIKIEHSQVGSYDDVRDQI